MSPKELLYTEDALGRIDFLRKKCTEYESCIGNEQLRGLVTRIGNEQSQLFTDFFNQL